MMSDDFPLLSISTPAIISLCAALPDDAAGLPTVFISSYPKSGTTWMQCIVYNLLSNGDQSFDHISNYSPFYEVSRTWDEPRGCLSDRFAANHRRLGARVFNTHLRYDMMPQGKSMKSIYVVRSGKDVALSFFHHLSNQDNEDNYKGSLSAFLQDWVSGRIIFGSWLKHMESWVQGAGSSSKVLIVRYEDLIRSLGTEMTRIAQFLELPLTSERIEELTQFVSFDFMKTHSAQFSPVSVPWKTGFEFIRCGTVGQSMTEFSAADHEAFDRMLAAVYPEGRPQWLQALEVS